MPRRRAASLTLPPHSVRVCCTRCRFCWRRVLPATAVVETGATATFAPGTKTRDYSYLGSDTVLHVGNDLELVPDLWLTTGLAAIYTRRETQVTYPEGQAPLSQHDWDYAPRIGLRYDFTPQLQVYGNLSRSVEPPHAWSMIWGSNKYFTSGPAKGICRLLAQFMVVSKRGTKAASPCAAQASRACGISCA